MKLNLKKIFSFFLTLQWIFPFLAFCIGYAALQFFLGDCVITTPNFIGKNILQATKLSSDLKLNLRIIAEKEIADAQPGTIIKQNPLPNASIKPHQSIFIAITKLPDPIKAPHLIGKSQQDIEKLCKSKGIKTRFYTLPSTYPSNQCFTQMPTSDQILEDKKMSCYISAARDTQLLFPDFTHKKLSEVVQFLEQNSISYDVYYKNQKIEKPFPTTLHIAYQKPLAGTIITLHQKLYVQLQAQ